MAKSLPQSMMLVSGQEHTEGTPGRPLETLGSMQDMIWTLESQQGSSHRCYGEQAE